MPTGGVDVVLGAGALAGAFGEAAPFVGAALAGAEGGAALGGVESAVTGGNVGRGILHGAEGGALTGGAIGVGGALAADTAIGAAGGDILGGAAGGALGAEVTGGNPLIGAAEGGIAGGIAGYNASGAPVNSSGSTVAAPSSSTNVTSPGGSTVSAGNVDAISNDQIASNLINGDQVGQATTQSPSLGSVAGGSSPAPANLPSLGPQGASAIGAADTGGIATGGSTPAAANLPSLSAGGAPASSGGLSDYLPSKSDVGGAVLKNALPLGALAYESIKGPAALPAASGAIGPGGANTAPLTAIETANANEAATGQLTPTQQQNVLQYVNSQQNQLLQQLASEGVQNPTNDSRYIAGMQQIQNNALALQQQYIQAAVSNAVSAGGAASQNIAQVANEQIQNDTAYQEALAQAFGALGGSLGGVTTPKAA